MSIKNFGNKINTNGFDKNPTNINREGRPMSIRTDLKNVLESNGQITIEAENVVQINDNGSVTIKLPTSETLALKLLEWVNSDNGNNSLKAIQLIMEQTEGKASTSNVEVGGNLNFKILNIDPLADSDEDYENDNY